MTILVVEDDRSFRKGLAYELEDLGYKVTEASDGNEAIELIHKYHFDLVISDLVMPEADGLEVYHILKKLQPHAKFILLTAFVESDKSKTARLLLKENFLEKSIGYDVLFRKIEQLLKIS
jgi:CheY-like chemotaxis protein